MECIIELNWLCKHMCQAANCTELNNKTWFLPGSILKRKYDAQHHKYDIIFIETGKIRISWKSYK